MIPDVQTIAGAFISVMRNRFNRSLTIKEIAGKLSVNTILGNRIALIIPHVLTLTDESGTKKDWELVNLMDFSYVAVKYAEPSLKGIQNEIPKAWKEVTENLFSLIPS